MAKGTPTQEFVPIKEIRDGVAVLKDGGLRGVILASSINFALKSADEQQAILRRFQSFLNTLDFSIQLYVQSRELDIEPYLELLRNREVEQSNDLMRTQLNEYIDFIENFTSEVDIMTKSFFVVVPYSPARVDVKQSIKGLFNRGKGSDPEATQNAFEENRTQIEQRMELVRQGLSSLGVRSVTLGTEEITDLFYHLFNPGETNTAPAQK